MYVLRLCNNIELFRSIETTNHITKFTSKQNGILKYTEQNVSNE